MSDRAGSEGSPATVLVTGGAGFIGSHLCDVLLARGERVVAIDDLSTGRLGNLAEARAAEDEFRFVKLDVRSGAVAELIQAHRPRAVVHLAADGRASARIDPAREARTGFLGLLAVLQAARAGGVPKVVVALPASVYGEPRKVPVAERSLASARPRTPSGISGLAALDYLRFYRASHGLEFTALVLPTVYGPRQDPAGEHGVVALTAGRLLRGEPPLVRGDGAQTRDLVFVDDVVHALVLALDHAPGLVLNVGTGAETSIRSLVEALSEMAGSDGEPETAPRRPGEVRRMALDPSEAERRLGWKPWTHLEDGLRETVAWLREGLGLE
jgi:UDP-glucose 4-epimerase